MDKNPGGPQIRRRRKEFLSHSEMAFWSASMKPVTLMMARISKGIWLINIYPLSTRNLPVDSYVSGKKTKCHSDTPGCTVAISIAVYTAPSVFTAALFRYVEKRLLQNPDRLRRNRTTHVSHNLCSSPRGKYRDWLVSICRVLWGRRIVGKRLGM